MCERSDGGLLSVGENLVVWRAGSCQYPVDVHICVRVLFTQQGTNRERMGTIPAGNLKMRRISGNTYMCSPSGYMCPRAVDQSMQMHILKLINYQIIIKVIN